jgi:alkanesulfonate monooxygenase SsuD/methylene tetrahydromethanopterin reductase-like flavin-dependent oxidoreductase (luciferase family)
VSDGWNAWAVSPEQFREEIAFVRAVAPDAMTMTWAGLALLGRDDAEAEKKAAGRALGPTVIAGGPDAAAARLQAYEAAGASWVILAPLDSSDPDNAAIIGEELIPRLSEQLQQ